MICIADKLFTIWSHIKCNLKFQVKFAENFNWPRVKKRNLQCVNYSIVFLLSICTCHKKVWEQKLHLPFPFTLSHVSRSRTKGVNTFLELTKSLLHAWGISFKLWPPKKLRLYGSSPTWNLNIFLYTGKEHGIGIYVTSIIPGSAAHVSGLRVSFH